MVNAWILIEIGSFDSTERKNLANRFHTVESRTERGKIGTLACFN